MAPKKRGRFPYLDPQHEQAPLDETDDDDSDPQEGHQRGQPLPPLLPLWGQQHGQPLAPRAATVISLFKGGGKGNQEKGKGVKDNEPQGLGGGSSLGRGKGTPEAAASAAIGAKGAAIGAKGGHSKGKDKGTGSEGVSRLVKTSETKGAYNWVRTSDSTWVKFELQWTTFSNDVV
jgi:hypothetical protein